MGWQIVLADKVKDTTPRGAEEVGCAVCVYKVFGLLMGVHGDAGGVEPST